MPTQPVQGFEIASLCCLLCLSLPRWTRPILCVGADRSVSFWLILLALQREEWQWMMFTFTGKGELTFKASWLLEKNVTAPALKTVASPTLPIFVVLTRCSCLKNLMLRSVCSPCPLVCSVVPPASSYVSTGHSRSGESSALTTLNSTLLYVSASEDSSVQKKNW